MEPQKKIWIVGGSSGIGLEFAKLCLEKNYKVVVSSRTASTNQSLQTLQKKFTTHLGLLDLDLVASHSDIQACVKKAWNYFDGLDICFYNAGAYTIMNIDSWESQEFAQMNHVNYLGVTTIMSALVVYFKIQKKGHWVWNSSVSSYFGLPQAGGYSAPKAALVNLAQSIHPELNRHNIDLQIINHGFVQTRLTDKNDFEMPQLMTPLYAAQKIFEGIQNPKRFEIRFPFLLTLFLRFLSLLPYRLSLSLTKRMLS